MANDGVEKDGTLAAPYLFFSGLPLDIETWATYTSTNNLH